MHDRPFVYVLILNYASAEQTLACVRSVQQLRYPCTRILVLDNDSPDGSGEELARALPEVEVCPVGRNRGYGDGNNLGIRRAIAAGADLIWIVTPDVRVEPDTLDPMVELFRQDSTIGIVGPVVCTGGRCLIGTRVYPWLGYGLIARYVEPAQVAGLPPALPTDYVEGCSILLRREMVEEIGLLRDDFFLYYEETEYCLRARDRGWRCVTSTRAQVHTRPGDEERNDRMYYMVRNSVLLARVRRSCRLLTVMRYVATIALHVLRLRPMPRRDYGRVAVRAVLAGFRHSLSRSPSLVRGECLP